MAELEPVTRPNGKTYRPHKIVTWRWENDDDESCGVLVLGMHDVDKARSEADKAIKYWFDTDLIATKPDAGWFRSGYHNGEPTWLRDPVKGRAGVMFTADYPEESTR